MKDRIYTQELPNWKSIQTHFRTRIPVPNFVYAFVARDQDGDLAVVLYSSDGLRFSGFAREADDEVIFRPLSNSPAYLIHEKLETNFGPLYPYFRGLDLWISKIQPPELPNVVSIFGPPADVIKLLRDGLGLTGKSLKRAVARARIMRVTPAQFHALTFMAQRFRRVTLDARFFHQLA